MRRLTRLILFASLLLVPALGRALGNATAVEIRAAYFGAMEDVRPLARARLAWALRTRTSVETNLSPGRVRFDDPSIFETPLLYVSGAGRAPTPTSAETLGLRRFVELGGFVVFDDANPENGDFGRSVRSILAAAFPGERLAVVPAQHTIYRSFYLVPRPVGRVEGSFAIEGITIDGRLAVIVLAHDLAGALSRDNLGSYTFAVTPGGDAQREQAFRFAVNILMYALCLDYKDDQVHAPFLMRRRPGGVAR